jgi:hypothetical protein
LPFEDGTDFSKVPGDFVSTAEDELLLFAYESVPFGCAADLSVPFIDAMGPLDCGDVSDVFGTNDRAPSFVGPAGPPPVLADFPGVAWDIVVSTFFNPREVPKRWPPLPPPNWPDRISIVFDPHEVPENLPPVLGALPQLELAVVSLSTGFDPHEDPEGLLSVSTGFEPQEDPEGLLSVSTGFDPHEDPEGLLSVSTGFDPHEDPEGLLSVSPGFDPHEDPEGLLSVSTGFDPHEDPAVVPSVPGALPHVERGAAPAFAEICEVATAAKIRFLRSSFCASRSSLDSFSATGAVFLGTTTAAVDDSAFEDEDLPTRDFSDMCSSA